MRETQSDNGYKGMVIGIKRYRLNKMGEIQHIILKEVGRD